MNLEVNKKDLFLISIIIILFSFSLFSFSFFNKDSDNKIVNIYYDNNLIYSYPLSVEKEIVLEKSVYEDLNEDMIIEIKDNKVRVKSEESPNNYCSLQGWSDSFYYPIVCLPNNVIVMIESKGIEDYDVVIYYE